MPIEIYFASSEPSPRVHAKRLERGQAMIFQNEVEDSIELVGIECNESDTGGNAYTRDIGPVEMAEFQRSEIMTRDHFSGHIDRNSDYRQVLMNGGVAVQMLAAYVDRTSNQTRRP